MHCLFAQGKKFKELNLGIFYLYLRNSPNVEYRNKDSTFDKGYIHYHKKAIIIFDIFLFFHFSSVSSCREWVVQQAVGDLIQVHLNPNHAPTRVTIPTTGTHTLSHRVNR